MAIFREYSSQKRDRTAGDIKRHRELVRSSIREGIADIIAEESIIGRNKKRKIKVPIKGLREYSFVYDENKKGVAQGTGNEQKGQVIDTERQNRPGKGQGKGGDAPGTDIYETEITIEEAINLMFEDLELPKLERKKFFETEVESLRKLQGYKRKGIRSRLSKRKTMVNRLKRKKASHQQSGQESFPFHNDDLVYRRSVVEVTKHSNAVVFCIMDASASMDTIKKYLARSFYFMLYQFLKTRYRNTEIVFIAHHTEAKEVSEDDFFHKVESGGTYISSGYRKALEIIQDRYTPDLWNIYAFHCSDGDNFDNDNQAAIETARKLADICNLFGYGEIKPTSSFSWSSMIENFEQINAENFICLKIKEKEDIWPAFKKFLTLDKSNQTAAEDE